VGRDLLVCVAFIWLLWVEGVTVRGALVAGTVIAYGERSDREG